MRGRTHFHTLGITPATDDAGIAKAYKDQVTVLLGDEDFQFRTSMRQAPLAREVQTLTEAFLALVNSDNRARYIRRLESMCMVCPVCHGRGFIRVDGGLTSIDCAACGRTGWAAEYAPTEVDSNFYTDSQRLDWLLKYTPHFDAEPGGTGSMVWLQNGNWCRVQGDDWRLGIDTALNEGPGIEKQLMFKGART